MLATYRSYCPSCDEEYTWKGAASSLGKSEKQMNEMKDGINDSENMNGNDNSLSQALQLDRQKKED